MAEPPAKLPQKLEGSGAQEYVDQVVKRLEKSSFEIVSIEFELHVPT